ncbi:cell adhesion molecule 2-like isoform X1 [Acipenser oxyrinchus oxyrinchus]|uniref:Cell adhesion molecule 2-like isoform X1 n=1 Tax=Acipenser oxyrinchus oxyrinchus TaxID=40147 RepID=A0AAD8CKY9_ACIOX|nr:cell adhesion molecule 2-like isoform X1 [Acipenser oxyrinchus oxyrinchus]
MSKEAPLFLLHLLSSVLLHPQTGAESLVVGLEVHQPARLSATLGETVTLHCNFTCTLQGRDRLYGKFYRVKGGKIIYTDNNTVSQTTCTVSSTIANITLESEAVYYCELKIPTHTTPINVNGSGTAVTVYAEPSSMEIPEPPILVVDTEALLSCAVNGFYPQNISVTWFHRDLQVPLTSITNHLTANRNGTFSLTSQYRFTPAVRDNGTVCRCQASHPAWRRHVTLERVLDVKYGPQSLNLTSQNRPVLGEGSNKTLELPAGSPLDVSCWPDGNPRPWTGWFKDRGDGLTPAEPPVGCSNETLHVGAVQREDEGVYWCVARNSYGERNTSFTLLVVVRDYVSLVSSVAVATCVLLLGVVLICLYARRKPRGKPASCVTCRLHIMLFLIFSPPLYNLAVYAVPQRRISKKQQPITEKLCTAEEPQLTYADIRFKPPPRHKKMRASENTEILYSETAGVCRPCEESRLEEPVCTVYALAQLP